MEFKAHHLLTSTLINWDSLCLLVDIDLNNQQKSTITETLDHHLNWLHSVNVILLSNYISAAKLVLQLSHYPHLTLNSHTKVYTTKPTFDLMRFCLEETISSYVSDTTLPSNLVQYYVHTEYKHGLDVQQIYRVLDNLATKVTYTTFGELTPLHSSFQLSCTSSGLTIGSSNWTLDHATQKLALISDSSYTSTRFPDPIDLTPLAYADVCLVSTTNYPVHQAQPWSEAVQHLERLILDHAHQKRPLVFPISVTGPGFFDTLHALCRTLEPTLLHSSLVVIVSPVMHLVSEYVNISSEHLNIAQKDRTLHGLLPMIPNVWSDPLYKSAFLVLESVADLIDPSTVLGDPSKALFVFAGHESLRTGDGLVLVNYLVDELNRRPTICFTHPEFMDVSGTLHQDADVVMHPLNPRMNRQELLAFLNTIQPSNLVTNCDSHALFSPSNLKSVNLLDHVKVHYVVPNFKAFKVDLSSLMYPAYMSHDLAKVLDQMPSIKIDDMTKAYTVPILWDIATNQLRPMSTVAERDQAAIYPPVYKGQFDMLRFYESLVKMYPNSQLDNDRLVVRLCEYECDIQFDRVSLEVEIQFHGPIYPQVTTSVGQILSQMESI